MTFLQHLTCALVVTTLFLWAYESQRAAGFVFEDLRWRATAATATAIRPRVLMAWSWRVQAALTPSAGAFHAVNLVGHVFVSALVGVLVWRLGAGPFPAWMAGGIFLLHPSSVETAAYLSARPEIFAALGVLTACVLAAGPWWRPWTLLGIGVSIGIGVLGKESAVVALGLVPLVLVTSGSWQRAPVLARRLGVLLWLGAFGQALAFAWRHGLWNAGAAVGVWMDWHAWLLLQAAAVWRSMGLALWPFSGGHTVDYDYDEVSMLLRVVALVALGALPLGAWRLRRRAPLMAFGLVWLLLSVAPRLVVRTPRSYLNDHQFYVPLMGAVFLVAGVIVGLVTAFSTWMRRSSEAKPSCMCCGELGTLIEYHDNGYAPGLPTGRVWCARCAEALCEWREE